MKRLILALCVVFILSIGLIGCEQKVAAIDQAEIETQSSNPQIENSNNQKEEEKIKETATKEVEEAIPSVNLKTLNDGTSKETDKIPDKYKKYLGYWQLNNSDFKYNDVIRGFLAPLEIVSISNGVFKGNLTGR